MPFAEATARPPGVGPGSGRVADIRSFIPRPVAWLVAVAAVTRRPFDFDGEPTRALRWSRALSPALFADYDRGVEFDALDRLLRKIPRIHPVGAAGPGAAARAGGLRRGGRFGSRASLPSRAASRTDALVAGFVMCLGARRDPAPPQPPTWRTHEPRC